MEAHDKMMAAVIGLAPTDTATAMAVQSGPWEEPETWGGSLPKDGDIVLIPYGVSVTISRESPVRHKTVRIDGELVFSSSDPTSLLVSTIAVTTTGKLVVGTEANPVTSTAEIVFIDDGPPENTLGRGLVAIGSVSICGATMPYTKDYEPLGDSWKPSASLYRSVLIRSENGAVDRRGHIMLMHNQAFHICHCTLISLGRTNKAIPLSSTNIRGRYPLHFHRCGMGSDHANAGHGEHIHVKQVVVIDSPGWGIVNHSSNVRVDDCITWRCFGAGFVGEAGDEKGHFNNCLAVASGGSGQRGGSLQIVNEARKSIGDFGHLGDGFWLQGPLIGLNDNVAVGNAFSGYNVYNNGFKEPDTGAIAFPLSRNTPLTASYRCVAVKSPFGRLDNYSMEEGSLVYDFVAKDCDRGTHQISALVEYRNPTYIGCRIGHDGGTDYGGPTRQYQVRAASCEIGVNIGSTRWLSGHSILDQYVGHDCLTDVLIRQADIGRTDINSLTDAKLQFSVNFTKGAYEIRQRLIYGDDGKREFYMNGKRFYFKEQHPSYIPWRDGPHKGKTNQQIFDETGKLPLGAMIPAGAIDRGEYWIEP